MLRISNTFLKNCSLQATLFEPAMTTREEKTGRLGFLCIFAMIDFDKKNYLIL